MSPLTKLRLYRAKLLAPEPPPASPAGPYDDPDDNVLFNQALASRLPRAQAHRVVRGEILLPSEEGTG